MSTARKALGLLPPCATTGIGSLPHTQGELALQMALQQDVAYLPQLPGERPSEFMIPAALDGVPGLRFDAEGTCTIDLEIWRSSRDAYTRSIEAALDSGKLEAFEPSSEACRSFRPFLFEVETRKLPFAKVQLAGPATVRCGGWRGPTPARPPAKWRSSISSSFDCRWRRAWPW